MNNAQLINQDSGNYEYYTPKFIVEACREVMGSIDYDPASSAKANETVKASKYVTESEDGLFHHWIGNVFMNHPFSRENNPLWINEAVSQFEDRWFKQLCCITYAATSERWFQPLMYYDICFLSPRTNYYLPDGSKKTGATKGSCVTYMGENREKFARVFSEFGRVLSL